MKGINDTANIDGIVPSYLVFGATPSYPITDKPLPGQTDRMKAIVDARLKMGTIVAEQRVTRALKSKLRPAIKFKIEPGDDVLVYREKKKKVDRTV